MSKKRIDPHKGQEVRYYREPNGDYLAIDYPSHKHYASARNSVLGCRCWEGRATCISGLITSVCTTGISGTFLMGCVKVRKADVPPEWIQAIGLEDAA